MMAPNIKTNIGLSLLSAKKYTYIPMHQNTSVYYNKAEIVVFDGRSGSSSRIYKLRSQPFKALDLWLKEYRNIWEEKSDNFDR